MTLPARTGRLAVYETPNGPFSIREFPLRPVRPLEALARVRMSTICRSDLHSYLGHRPNPSPGVLGHEIIGTLVELGENVTHDMRGEALAVGDRVTWSEYFIPGPDDYSETLDLPQKARGVEKYGHMAATSEPHHHGGFGEYCYILPRSWILKLPRELSDEEATPINCGVATMMSVAENARIKAGDAVVIQGLGLLGLYGASIAKSRGARVVIGLDRVASRRALASRFGADHVLDPSASEAKALVERIRSLCPPDGADAILEVCGDPTVIPWGLECLRIGGRYALAGVVNPASNVTIDANLLLRRMITLQGVHNYHPRNLAEALDFVVAQRTRFPFGELVDGKYPLAEVERAMRDAEARRVLRAAIVP